MPTTVNLRTVSRPFGITVCRRNVIAQLDAHFGCDRRTYHRLEEAAFVAPALHITYLDELVFPISFGTELSFSNMSGVVPTTRNRPK